MTVKQKVSHFRYEHRTEPVIPREAFYSRIGVHALVSFVIVGFSLGVGVLGYHFIEGFNWIDSLHNASMILSGMGPVGEIHTSGGKIFASCYALFSGIVFLATVGFLAAPIVHRLLHLLSLEGR